MSPRIETTPPHTIPGTVIVRLRSGSYAYNTTTPDSDQDFRGVFLLPTETFLGLGVPKTTHQEAPDQTSHELGHYMRLLLKGNPNIVEMLYIGGDNLIEAHELWDELCLERERFITRQMASAYRGWIFGEIASAERKGEGFPSKRLSHVLRLAYELEDAVLMRMLFPMLHSWRREAVMDIKEGRTGLAAVKLEVERIMAEVEGGLAEMPAQPPYEWANQFLVSSRLRFPRG